MLLWRRSWAFRLQVSCKICAKIGVILLASCSERVPILQIFVLSLRDFVWGLHFFGEADFFFDV